MPRSKNRKGNMYRVYFAKASINSYCISRHNVESNKPLLARLEKLEQDIKKQQQEIMNFQSNILRNEMRIKELIQK